MPLIKIVLKVSINENLIKDKTYWLFKWKLRHHQDEVQAVLDGYTEDMAYRLFSNPTIMKEVRS